MKISKELITELRILLKKSDAFSGTGIHSRVEKKNIYSGEMIRRFKSGKKDLANESKVKELIKAYKLELSKIERV